MLGIGTAVEAMKKVSLIIVLLVVNALGQSDFEALLELKKGIQKDPSGQVLDSWDSKSLASDGCPQNWFGISCSDGRVTSIILNDVGLVGNFSFPAVIGLKMLRNLSISNNQLMGTITNIGSLQSLEFLDLSRNMFHGLIPSGIVKLKNLVLLNLSSNSFEGTFASGFGNLGRLKYLDLRANGFNGDIMHLVSQLGSLVHVDLSSNKFSGSLDLGLGKPGFVSAIQYLNISYNSLTGELFAHDGTPYFDSLEVFDASNNQLAGDIPSFNFVVSLRILRLRSNQLSGSLPEALLQESSMVLSELDISHNQLEGPVGSITSATLKMVNLSSNKLSGSLPVKVGHCAIVDLSNNRLSGSLSRMQSWGNYVEGIHLSSNSLAGALPNETSQFLRLSSLKVSNNSLEGILPAVLGTYPELKVIDLSLNHLSGLLLPSFFNSTKLTDINLSGNNFTGPLPLQATQRTPISSTQSLSLQSLDLSYNSLSGHLPPELSKFHNLVYLNLSNNKFEGSIPDGLPDDLKGLNVSFNNLSGVVPYNLRRFPESAFHPGNSLLRLIYLPLSPGVPDLNMREHGNHMKPSTKIALIAGLVSGAAAIVTIFCIMVYWVPCQKHRRNSLNRDGEEKNVPQGVSSLSHKSILNKKVDPSFSSFGSNQDLLPVSQMGSSYDSGVASAAVKKPKDSYHLESIKKDEGLSSPMSILSSSSPSPSTTQIDFMHHDVFKVCSPEKLDGDLHLFDGSLVFTAEELSHAPAEVVGRSCHGTLYKATLDSGNVLAVKWLREGIAKGRKEFAREVKKLGNIKHPNLVSLRGYYWGPKEHEKLVISNYINAQCLSLYLQETDPRQLPPLSIDKRLRVAVDVARCLNYLHNERAIPHGNLKSSNILLETPNMNAVLTDYSLHRILTPAGTAEQVLNAGALGYRPPEFASSSKPLPSLKSDVYAFGVILLELLTGKSSGEIVCGDPRVVDLTDWVRLLAIENRSGECFDNLIMDGHNVEHPPRILHEMLHVALRCILPASERPDMKSVFEDLSTIVLQEVARGS